MKQISTQAIILKRLDYGEADRILTVLTKDHGRVSILAKGVRRSKSKMAGGLELFSTTNITFIDGRGELKTLIGTQIIKYYSRIVSDIDRTMFAYEMLKALYTSTHHGTEDGYYRLAAQVFEALDELDIGKEITKIWFVLKFTQLSGSGINLEKPLGSVAFSESSRYAFSSEDMAFMSQDNGSFGPRDIKFLRFASICDSPKKLMRLEGGEASASIVSPLLQNILKSYL